VRGPKHVVKCGKTPVLTPDEARKLLDSIDVATLVGLRDRALIAMMAYSFARVSAAVAMRVEDYFGQGKRWWVRLHEKGGKRHEMPCHHNLEAYLDAYIKAAGIGNRAKSPLFRSAAGRTDLLTDKAMNRVDAWRMIQRRAGDLGTRVRIGCHTFRATGITAYLEAGPSSISSLAKFSGISAALCPWCAWAASSVSSHDIARRHRRGTVGAQHPHSARRDGLGRGSSRPGPATDRAAILTPSPHVEARPGQRGGLPMIVARAEQHVP